MSPTPHPCARDNLFASTSAWPMMIDKKMETQRTTLRGMLSRKFRALLSGDPSGTPPWLPAIASGEGPGLYGPGDAPWIVHGDLATLVGGIRALLLQAMHPGSLTGVRAHSRYQDDPLGRLAGTIRWLTITTFGSLEAVAKEATRVNRMHQHVTGAYQNARNESRAYQAGDPDLLLWVHLAFMDSFLRCHQLYSSRPIPGGADAYIKLWAKAVVPLGLHDAPYDETSMRASLASYQHELTVADETRAVIHWLRHPPLPASAQPFYQLFFHAALASLAPEHRKLLGWRTLPLGVLRPLTRVVLRGMRIVVGRHSPLEDAALERLQRSNPREVPPNNC